MLGAVRLRFGFVSSLVSLAGCVGAPAPLAAPPTVDGPLVAAESALCRRCAVRGESTRARRVALHFELNGRKFPLPLVHGVIGGVPVWMLVDTGANSHVIASWVARKAGMRMRSLGDVGSDHTGQSVPAYSVDNPRVVIDDWGALPNAAMLVTDVPQPIEHIGIGAFVSPQWLAGAGEGVVLDLAAREMRTAPWEQALRSLDERGGVEIAPAGARLCRDDSSAIRGLAFVLPASIDGHAVDLLLSALARRCRLCLTRCQAAKVFRRRARPQPRADVRRVGAGEGRRSFVPRR